MMIKLPPPWSLVLIGLILNIFAILLSSIVLDSLSGTIAELEEKKQENQYSIQLSWNSVETLERKREALLQHIHLHGYIKAPNPLNQMLAEQLQGWVNQPVPQVHPDNLAIITQLIDQSQQVQRDTIDNYFLENLSLNDQVMALNKDIALYKNIALFLQVFGLALILAKDLARKA
ncbi:DNA mismatch repair protein [Vibrio profundum]|uniref:DNA mismatch repair protein n=1 Tax=Vibrio profundum TaxID=2910247 RepID=UPI003D0D5AE3